MINGCISFAETNGISVALSRMTWEQVRQGQLPVAIQRQHVDGVVFRGWLLPEVEKMFEKITMPIVWVDCDRRVEGQLQVCIDNLHAMDQIVEHLLQKGCRRFATITGDMEHLNAQERLAGLQISLVRRGLSLDPQNIVTQHGFNDESGRRGVKVLIDRHREIDALVCQNDLIAVGAMESLQAAGINVPGDIRVTGFDNMEFNSTLVASLTTIDSHPFEIGQLGAQLLNHPLKVSGEGNLQIRSPVSLIVRDSA
jgi:LacI family transcriptional regulator